MLGKITDSQTEFLLNRINNLADGGEYTLVHLGCGIPELPGLRLDKWAREIHLAQCERVTCPVRGHEYRRLSKRINLILSDIAFQENLPSGPRASLRNAEDSVENGPTGIQEYRYLDAKELDLDSNSVDMIVAIGLFTKFVSNVAENLTTILSEISRVLNHEGELVMTIHEDYLSWFHDSISQFQYEVVVKQCEADHSPEGDRGGARCLLVLKFGR